MIALLVSALVGQSCIQQQSTTYAAPVYQQQAYNTNAYVEKVIFVAVEDAQTYYSGLVGQQQRAIERQAQSQQATASVDTKLDRLTALVEQLQRRIEQDEPPIPSKPAAQPALPALSPVASEAVPLPPTVAQAASVKSAGLALLAQKCGACHTGAAQKGRGFAIFAADGSLAKLDRVSLENIDAEIASGRMPKRSANLTLREYVTIRDFLGEQASSLALAPAGKRGKRS